MICVREGIFAENVLVGCKTNSMLKNEIFKKKTVLQMEHHNKALKSSLPPYIMHVNKASCCIMSLHIAGLFLTAQRTET